DPFAKADVFQAADVESVTFDELLARSDFVSVHARLMPETRAMMNATAFAKMKKGALLINTARGPLIDENALVAALDSVQLRRAALGGVACAPLAQCSALLRRGDA